MIMIIMKLIFVAHSGVVVVSVFLSFALHIDIFLLLLEQKILVKSGCIGHFLTDILEQPNLALIGREIGMLMGLLLLLLDNRSIQRRRLS